MTLKYITDSTHNNTDLLECIAHLMFFILYIFLLSHLIYVFILFSINLLKGVNYFLEKTLQ